MKHLSIKPIISFVAITALLLAGCDSDMITQQDNAPPLTSQAPTSVLKTPNAVADTNLIPGQYIVVYKDRWNGRISNPIAQQALEFVNARVSELGIASSALKHRYEYALRGFTAKLTDQQLEIL